MDEVDIVKLETDADGQVLHLPEGFRLPGQEVRLRRVDGGVMVEPIDQRKLSIEEFFARIDAEGGGDFLPEGRPEQPPMPPEKLFD